jgi:hypothetical protein
VSRAAISDKQQNYATSSAAIMKHVGTSLMVFFLLSEGCQRQIPILGNPVIIGYQVQGTVTDQVGNPVPHVDVLLDYIADAIQSDSVATRRFFLQDPSVPVQTVVADWNNRVIRVLRQPQNFYGWYQTIWDGKDSTGTVPPSGIYHVEYVVGGVVQFSYKQLASGGKVASTDAQGRYTITMQNLPIDSSSVPWFSPYDSSYVGNLLISNIVVLTYVYPNHAQQLQRTLDNGHVTIINVVFH